MKEAFRLVDGHAPLPPRPMTTSNPRAKTTRRCERGMKSSWLGRPAQGDESLVGGCKLRSPVPKRCACVCV